MTGRLRKAGLAFHVTASVGWLGSVAAFLAVAGLAATSTDADLVRSAFLLMEPMGWLIVVPLALASLVSGLIQSLGTPWGLVRHYWIIFKLVINVLCLGILLDYTRTLSAISNVAQDSDFSIDNLGHLRFSPLLHSTLALIALVLAVVLAIFKPKGVTRFGRQTQNRSMDTQRA